MDIKPPTAIFKVPHLLPDLILQGTKPNKNKSLKAIVVPVIRLLMPPEHQSRIGAAKSEAVRHDTVKVGIILAFARDRKIGERWIDFLDIGALADEAIIEHDQREYCLLNANGPKRVPSQ